jgi:hypothetical protein
MALKLLRRNADGLSQRWSQITPVCLPCPLYLQKVWGALDIAQLDMLCRIEHERRAVPLWLAGWVAGERNDALRNHSNLVPYKELKEGTRNYDLK